MSRGNRSYRRQAATRLLRLANKLLENCGSAKITRRHLLLQAHKADNVAYVRRTFVPFSAASYYYHYENQYLEQSLMDEIFTFRVASRFSSQPSFRCLMFVGLSAERRFKKSKNLLPSVQYANLRQKNSIKRMITELCSFFFFEQDSYRINSY